MASIFLSHSKRDEGSVSLLSKAAAGTRVELYRAEFETQIGIDADAEELAKGVKSLFLAF